MSKSKIIRVWVDQNSVYATTEDGRTASYQFADWKRLRMATLAQREDFYLTYSGIHWPQIDEDLSFEGMFANAGLCSRTESEDSVYWEPSPKEYPTNDGESHLFVAEADSTKVKAASK